MGEKLEKIANSYWDKQAFGVIGDYESKTEARREMWEVAEELFGKEHAVTALALVDAVENQK